MSEWQPIETAKKDGTRLLLGKFVGHPDHDTCCWWAITGFWSDKWHNWNDGLEPAGLAEPSHWMPIPRPWPLPQPPEPDSNAQ